MKGGAAFIDEKIKKDIEVLAEFISLYCDAKHGNLPREPVKTAGTVQAYLGAREITLCGECRALLLHAVSKRIICPYDPKPSCKNCETHCYEPAYREKIRRVMKFSGMRMIKKGKLGLLKKYFL